jgi:hypothetical protein
MNEINESLIELQKKSLNTEHNQSDALEDQI